MSNLLPSTAKSLSSGTSDPSNNQPTAYSFSNEGFFAGAVRADVRYGTFKEYHGPVNIFHSSPPTEIQEIFATLKPVDRSGHNVTGCMDGTREYIFEEIDKWLVDPDDPNILWLSGSPGAGKSAIASSLVSWLIQRRQFGAAYFFKRDDVILSNPAALWRTVACDLAQSDPRFANALAASLKETRVDAGRPDIELHFKYLIEGPMTKTYTHSTPPVIVIDALDECDAERSQAVQRKLLLKTLVQWSHFPKKFKLIVTGRDERVPKLFRTACKWMVLPTGGDVSDDANKDIRKFFEVRFSKLDDSLFPEWPGEQALKNLTTRAAGLFIWAEMVMRLIEQGLPNERLKLVLDGDMGDGNDLAFLYRQVLDISFRGTKGRTLEVVKLTLTAIVIVKVPFHYDDLHLFVSEDRSSVKFVLDKLSSVILVGTRDMRIRIGHLSFSDFLCDSNECPEAFFIDWNKGSSELAMKCFQRMEEGLKFNICGLETSYLRNSEVKDLPERIKMNISGSLFYSCRYWAAHLRDIASTQEDRAVLISGVRQLLYDLFLFWLEVMSFLEQALAANSVILTAIPWIAEFDTDLSDFARDASRFIINFETAISDSVPHIYLSALPFSPSDSLIAQRYRRQFMNTVSVISGRVKNWPAMINLLRGHSDTVNSVIFSQDGKRVVSGSSDKTIRIWDADTGQITASPFEGHTDWVNAVAISLDGKRIVSGSEDTSIRIWDAETGQITAGPFKDQTDAISSVAFSWDGKRIVSGSSEGTIQVLNVETGQVTTSSSEGAIGDIHSIAFSPDGKRIISRSDVKTVCIWDAETGHVIAGPVESPAPSVESVAFSHDGKVILSSSKNAIHIWNTENGQITAGPFQGHPGLIFAAAFSQDSKRLASALDDNTICILDVETGQITAGPFDGHTDSVNSVAFSQDGKRVVSCSYDQTVRIWDVEAGRSSPSHDLDSCVYAVSFSQDDKQVVSASSDRTIRVWNAETGQIIAGPFEGHPDIKNPIALSRDRKQVISRSDDNSLRIFDLETGQIIAGPFEGHTDHIYSAAFSQDNKLVVSGSNDKTIRVWNVDTGEIAASPFKGHPESVVAVAFSHDSKQVVSGSYDHSIRLWDVETGQSTAGSFEGHSDSVISVAFSQDDKWIVSGSSDNTIRIWDTKTGQMTAGPFKGHTDWVNSVAFSQDGKRLVSSSFDKTIRVWNVEISCSRINSHAADIPSSIGDIYHLDSTSAWSLFSDGDGENRLLFWVPQFYRIGLCGNATLALIGADSIRLDLSRFARGRSWTQCRSPQLHDSESPDCSSPMNTNTSEPSQLVPSENHLPDDLTEDHPDTSNPSHSVSEPNHIELELSPSIYHSLGVAYILVFVISVIALVCLQMYTTII